MDCVYAENIDAVTDASCLSRFQSTLLKSVCSGRSVLLAYRISFSSTYTHVLFQRLVQLLFKDAFQRRPLIPYKSFYSAQNEPEERRSAFECRRFFLFAPPKT